jgi:hypothetical protein
MRGTPEMISVAQQLQLGRRKEATAPTIMVATRLMTKLNIQLSNFEQTAAMLSGISVQTTNYMIGESPK